MKKGKAYLTVIPSTTQTVRGNLLIYTLLYYILIQCPRMPATLAASCLYTPSFMTKHMWVYSLPQVVI